MAQRPKKKRKQKKMKKRKRRKLPKNITERPDREVMERIFGKRVRKEVDKVTKPAETKDE